MLNREWIILAVSAILTVTGAIILLNGPDFGAKAANAYLRNKVFGSMDTGNFLVIKEGYILSYITMGATLFVSGIVSMLYYLYKRT